MQIFLLRVNLAIWLMLNLLTWQIEPTRAAPPDKPFVDISGVVATVATDENTVIWVNVVTLDYAVYAAKFNERIPFLVADEIGQRYISATVDGDFVVWNQRQDCPTCSNQESYVKNLTTGEQFKLGDFFTSKLAGDWVLWFEYSKISSTPQWNIRNVKTKAAAIPLTPTQSNSTIESAIITRDKVIWNEVNNTTGQRQLVMSLIGQLKPTVYAKTLGQVTLLDFRDDLVFYIVDRKLIILDLKNDKKDVVVENINSATTDGHFVFWEDASFDNQKDPPNKRRIDLKGYDAMTKSYFDVVSNNGFNLSPQTKGGTLVWIKGISTFGNKIYATKIGDILPSARQPALANNSYFTETGHNLGGTFKAFWDKNGGLPVFGYPQTEEYIETNRDSNKNFTVQFFERQRYEYHPENKGTPYEVELGRLGVTDAQRRNLLTTPAFQPTSDKGGSNCTYFADTSHKACGSFLTYWQAHGLEFGDSGISYREALALFGNPISEEFDDPDTKFRTQYFERAVFEYHPENKGTPYEVLLKLVGNVELQNRGWR